MSELIDYINMSPERLDARGKELTAAVKGNYLNEERKAQVQNELSDIAFELWCRYNAGDVEFVEQ